MKSTKILAALASTALLAACSQEELVESNNIPQQMEEIVGAKLVGSDVSMNVSMGSSSASSRFAEGLAGWDDSDVVGLGWLVNGDVRNDVQSESKLPSTSNLYANHMYNYSKTDKVWTAKGNLYEGWYFAYYPWSYEKKAGELKYYTMNPDMIGRGVPYHQSQSLYLANKQFVSANPEDGDFDVKTNTLLKKFEMYQAVKFIRLRAEAKKGSAFAKNDDNDLDELVIEKVTIDAGEGNNIFAKEVVIRSKELPTQIEYSKDKTTAETDKENLAAFRKAYSNVVAVPTAKPAVSTIERNVKEANLLVSTNPTEEGGYVDMYMNVLPMTNENLSVENIKITVHTNSASFVIDNKEGQSEKNIKALQAIADAYKVGGALSTINELDENGDPAKTLSFLDLQFELRAEDFVTDFSSITDITEWNDAVKLTQQLKREQETFYIDGNIEFDGAINMPEGCKLTVIPVSDDKVDNNLTDNMITLKGTFENGIPANLDIKDVDVVVEGTVKQAQTINAKSIVNNGTLEVADGNKDNVMTLGSNVCPVTNLGTIELHKYAKVTNVDNAGGRINVIYGSFVELQADDKAGEIAYQVKEADVKKPSRIQNVINTADNSADRYALVNILVFDTVNGIADFDFTLAKSAVDSDEDPYNPTEGSDADTYTFDGIEKVSLEINGVNVKSSTKPVCVKNVTIKNADLGEGVAVDGDLNIEGGNVNVTTGHINGTLNITAGQGTITSETIASVNIESGAFTINAETIEGNVTATGENYFNVETIKGNVVLTNNSTTVTHIEGATIEGDVTLNGSWDLRGVTFKGNLTVNGAVKSKDLTIDNTLIVNEGAKFGISGEDATISHIKNYGELTTSVNVYAKTVRIYDRSDANVATGMTIWYTEPTEGQYGYTQEGTTHGRILYFGAQWASTLGELQNAIDAAVEGENVILFGGDIEGTLTVTQKKDVKITIDGRNHQLAGSIIVDGKSARFETAALNISNIDFRGTTSETVFINLGVSGNNATRYTNHVTVDGCTFEGEECVAIKSYTGGDKNLKINNCVVAKNMHSFVQVANVEEGLEIANSQVYSKNGVNLNATLSLLMDKCTFDVRGYAVRLGQGTNVAGEGKAFEIKNSALKSACEESDDAVIVFRGDAKKATLTLVNTSITGEPQFKGEEVATIIK